MNMNECSGWLGLGLAECTPHVWFNASMEKEKKKVKKLGRRWQNKPQRGFTGYLTVSYFVNRSVKV